MIDLTQFKDLGVVAVIFLFFIQQFFAFLKTWKEGKVTNGNGIKEQLNVISTNHLNHIEQAIREQTKLFQDDHNRNIEVLYKIQAGVEQLNKK